jgi:GntR family transcriptional regulator, uxu operon transcriptional repressor
MAPVILNFTQIGSVLPIAVIGPSRRLYREIAEQLEMLINSGEFPPGSRLPSERELARLFGVSRPPVREALLALEIAGLIDVRIGSGVWVVGRPSGARPGADAQETADSDEPGPFELIQARQVLEGEIAALAARAASESDLEGIRETIDQMIEENARNAVEQEADRLFHLRIAGATGNSAFVHLMRSIWEFRYGPMWSKIEEHFLTPQRRAQTVKDHTAIYQALKARDPAKARDAMHDHLRRVHAEFAKEWDEANRPC